MRAPAMKGLGRALLGGELGPHREAAGEREGAGGDTTQGPLLSSF